MLRLELLGSNNYTFGHLIPNSNEHTGSVNVFRLAYFSEDIFFVVWPVLSFGLEANFFSTSRYSDMNDKKRIFGPNFFDC